MSIRRAVPLTLLAAVTAVLCSALPAGATITGLPELLPPDQAEALATAPAPVPSGSTTSLVDGIAVLQAATLPGPRPPSSPASRRRRRSA